MDETIRKLDEIINGLVTALHSGIGGDYAQAQSMAIMQIGAGIESLANARATLGYLKPDRHAGISDPV